ncbi:Flp pilus assembly protein CpaB [Trichococcus ilyis]|uniref:Pilus assembly flp-type cpab n=1 Tax=Trichococcus ilyis TaxID=640938 RepID=A0A143Z809_9LACT|nr:Flp pilus assembly protein CpaB [Trichococcus ilyis]CZR10356.1 pilus assembly flp-type cpab [Trichococcus ilyis]SEJ95214.1 pilus assembly protein CpaB [Trichococcus ilyis]
MKTKKRIWIITGILALLTTGMLYIYLQQVEASAQENQVEMSEVVVALTDIPAHVKVTEDMLEFKEIPSEAVHADTYTAIADVVGGTTTTGLVAGEQVLTERIVATDEEAELSYRIPESMRAITVATSEVDGVGGYVMAGDKLDILVSYTPSDGAQVVYTQLQNIEVLERGPNAAVTDSSVGTGVPTSLTLLVTPAQAEVIAFANLNGTFYFTLRNPVDTAWQDLGGYGTDNFDSWRER